MKEQKKVLFCSAGVMLLSLALSVILEFGWGKNLFAWALNVLENHRSFVVNFCVGICTGTFLSFCMAWINYVAEREKCIVEFSNLVEDFYTICSKLQYLYIRGEGDLLAAYYREECANKEFSKVLEKHTAKDRLLQSYKEKDPECDENMRLLEDTDTIDREINRVIESYYAVSSFDFSKIERILKKKSFILPHNKTSKQIDAVYSYIKELYSAIVDKVEYWRDFDAPYNLIVGICQFQPRVFADLERYGNVTFLPPQNKVVNEIKELLSTLKQ